MKKIILMLVAVMLAGCADDVNQIINRGGALQRSQEYNFVMMRINDIRASEKASQASFRVHGASASWTLPYEGDLGDFENGDFVEITIKDLKVVDISEHWFFVRYAFMMLQPLLGRVPAYVISKYILPILTFIFVVGFFAYKGDEDEVSDESE